MASEAPNQNTDYIPHAPAETVTQVVCPACGWRETRGQSHCRSCWAALDGAAVEAAPASIRALTERSPEIFVPRRSAPAVRWKHFALVAIAGLGIFQWMKSRPVTYPAGMLVAEPPVQKDAAGKAPWVLPDGTRVIPLASYQIKARLLHRERYRFDAMSDLSPVDFGAGWHRMSDQSVIDGFRFSNSHRYLSFTTGSAEEAEANAASAANMHMLPSDDIVRKRLLDFQVGELFSAKGWLVSVERPGMNPWTSSLSREDSGSGACEIMWVEEIHRIEPPGSGG